MSINKSIWIGLLGTIILSYYTYSFLDQLGFFLIVTQINHESCYVTSKETIGTEDIVVLSKSQLAILPSDHRDWIHPGFISSERRSQSQLVASFPTQGSLYFLDLKNLSKDSKPILGRILDYPYPDFHLIGVGLYEKENQKPLLFAVNVVREGNSVDVFEVDEENLSFQFKYRVLEGFINLNDVQPVDETSFFVSRVAYCGKEDYQSVYEIFARPKWSSLLYCEKYIENDQHTCQVILDSLSGTNGVTFSKDRKFLFVAEMMAEKLNVYSIDWKHNENNENKKGLTKVPILSFLYDIKVGMMADNLSVDEDNNIFLSGHLSGLKTIAHLTDKVSPCPSKVIRFSGDFSKKSSVVSKDVLIVDGVGDELSAVSVTVHFQDKLITGSILQRGIMVCPYNPN